MDVIIDLIKPFLEDRREDDAFDRLNYKSTPILLFLSVIISTAKLYIGGIIECFTKAEFANGWIEYTKDYCFVENTYYLYEHESDDLPHELRQQRYIAYYQWAPFILGLQAISFYIPHMIFRSFNWITGYQIYTIVNTAVSNRMEEEKERKDAISSIGTMLYRASQNQHRWFQVDGQKFVAYTYFGMKFFYLILICIHMYVFKIFIGSLTFAFDILYSGGEWRQSGLFPRVTVCDMQILRFGAPLNYTMECVLPFNMFNEKIFMFFYFWMIILFCLNVWSIWVWVQRISNRKKFFHRLLKSFNKDKSNWRVEATPETTPMTDNSFPSKTQFNNVTEPLKPHGVDTYGVSLDNIDYGWDMCLVLSLLREHVGILFTSDIFKKVNAMREEEDEAKKKRNGNISSSSSE